MTSVFSIGNGARVARRLAAGFGQRWNRYWFGNDGTMSIELVRIGLALSMLLTWDRVVPADYAAHLARYPRGAYSPLGTMALFGSEPPPAWLLEGVSAVALIAIFSMLAGLFTRVSMVVAAVAMLVVASVFEGLNPPWHHSVVPVLVAQIAFCAAPAGRCLSVDALLRRWWRRRAGDGSPPAGAPAWPVYLVQLLVALVYANAAYWKLTAGEPGAWIFSDNLRHHLLTRFDWSGVPRTEIADLLLRNELLWQAAALLNVIAQTMPLVACLFVRRWRVRAALGAFFVVETILLDLVMDLPNPQWIPLAFVFVDWDRLIGWCRGRCRRVAGCAPPIGTAPAISGRGRWLATAFICVVGGASLLVGFGPPRADIRFNTYPLSQYRMFSKIRAKKPYDLHQSWEWDALRFSVDPHLKKHAKTENSLNNRFRKRQGIRTAAATERVLREAALVRPRLAGTVAVSLAIAQVPPYPIEPELVFHEIGKLGRLRDHRFESVLGRAGTDALGAYFEMAPVGLEARDLTFGYILDLDPQERPLPVLTDGWRSYYRPVHPGRHTIIAHLAGERFIAAQAKHRPSRQRAWVRAEVISATGTPVVLTDRGDLTSVGAPDRAREALSRAWRLAGAAGVGAPRGVELVAFGRASDGSEERLGTIASMDSAGSLTMSSAVIERITRARR